MAAMIAGPLRFRNRLLRKEATLFGWERRKARPPLSSDGHDKDCSQPGNTFAPGRFDPRQPGRHNHIPR
jgi:hypothetical protein